MKNADQLVPCYIGKMLTQLAVPKWLIALGAGALNYVLPEIEPGVALATGGLVILDTATGVVRAYTTGQAVTSAKLGRFLTKIFSYAVAMLTIALALHVVPSTDGFHTPALTVIITGIAVTESYSIFENLQAMGYSIPEPIKELLRKMMPKGKDDK